MTQTMGWAKGEFGAAGLGDVRRTRRLIMMAAAVARAPSGKVSSVFNRTKEREGAYDFLESPQVEAGAIAASIFAATAVRSRGLAYAYVVIDGSSLSLSDAKGTKGFGPVGTRTKKANGLVANTALAVSDSGTPLGIIDQMFWSRPPTLELTKTEVWQRNQERDFSDKEPAEIVRSAERAMQLLRSEGVQSWIVVDRVADNRDILLALSKAPCVFTVRATYNRHLSEHKRLYDELAIQPVLGRYRVQVPRTGNRATRDAEIEIRAKRVELLFRDRLNKHTERLKLTAVWLHEPSGEKNALDWMLYTNAPVNSAEEGRRIVEAYRTRWRIEEFHRTWKQGHCNVEDTQLRSPDAVAKWAIILGAVAARVERLKYTSRTHPQTPALGMLSQLEIEVLQLNHQQRQTTPSPPKKLAPAREITIEQATHWIAELGGWIGKTNGPPGSVTLARGLERLAYLVEGVALARAAPLSN
jgi:hypothetical protein